MNMRDRRRSWLGHILRMDEDRLSTKSTYDFQRCYHESRGEPPDGRWNWLGRILRLEEHRVIRQVPMNYVKPTLDSLFGDVPDLDGRKAVELTADREEWKGLRSSKRS